MIALETKKKGGIGDSAAKAWLRALELTASIPRTPDRVIANIVDHQAAIFGQAPALLSDRECYSYRDLACRQNQYARWALEQGVAKGDVVCLLMPNQPEYVSIWLGITSVGGVVALLNTNLVGPSLAHCIAAVRPKHIIVSGQMMGALDSALPTLVEAPTIWIHGADHDAFARIDLNFDRLSGEMLARHERPTVTIADRALCIYTSGTTGLPKAAHVSHARVLQWSLWFAGMMGMEPDDRIYNCLPMYHSVGGVLVPGSTLASGASMVVREKFSVQNFWSDVIRWDCTMVQYIGELCRYLLHSTSMEDAAGHRIRMACGNGLAAEVWESFQDHFQIPRILEFYAATEGGLSLFNVEGKPGAIGRIPAYLAHRFSPALVRFDTDAGEPVRSDDGFCVRALPHEAGEALARIADDPSTVGSRFEGYTDELATERRILRNVFAPGDAWVRTGDLMRRDEQGYFYFVDRAGDTFRWKGENVATSEVSQVICAYPGVTHASVYGVPIPGTEGRAGMAAVITQEEIDLQAFRRFLVSRLPPYARPLFLRFRDAMDLTGTFKYSKTELGRQGYDPLAVTDRLYFDNSESEELVPLEKSLYERIQRGQVRL